MTTAAPNVALSADDLAHMSMATALVYLIQRVQALEAIESISNTEIWPNALATNQGGDPADT